MYNLYHLIAKWAWCGVVLGRESYVCAVRSVRAQCAVCGRSAWCVGAGRSLWAQGAGYGRSAQRVGAVRFGKTAHFGKTGVWAQCAVVCSAQWCTVRNLGAVRR